LTIINVALSGMSGSGKTTFANHLINNYNFTLCNTGKTCRKICNILFGNESKTLLNQVTDALKTIDKNIWFKKALSEINQSIPTVVDSMRFKDDYLFMKEQGFILVKVQCHQNLIIDRLKKRGQKINPEIDFKHKSEIELEHLQFTHTLSNNSTIDDFYLKIDELLKPYIS